MSQTSRSFLSIRLFKAESKLQTHHVNLVIYCQMNISAESNSLLIILSFDISFKNFQILQEIHVVRKHQGENQRIMIR